MVTTKVFRVLFLRDKLICSGLLGTPVALDRETREMEAENLLTNFYAQEGESQR